MDNTQAYKLCSVCVKRYPADFDGLYCPACGTPLIERNKPPKSPLENFREEISYSESHKKYQVLRFVSKLLVVFGIGLVVFSFIIPAVLVSSSNVPLVNNPSTISDGAGPIVKPQPVYQTTLSGLGVFLGILEWFFLFWIGIGTIASGEMVIMFIDMHDELSSLKAIVKSVTLLLLNDHP